MASCTKLRGLAEKHSSSKVLDHTKGRQKRLVFVCLTFNLPLEQTLVSVMVVFWLIPLGLLVRQSSANDPFVSPQPLFSPATQEIGWLVMLFCCSGSPQPLGMMSCPGSILLPDSVFLQGSFRGGRV